MSWRSDPATLRQLSYIEEMREFSEYALPLFTGKTKGQAAAYIDKYTNDHIDKYTELAHTSLNDLYHDDAGDRV